MGMPRLSSPGCASCNCNPCDGSGSSCAPHIGAQSRPTGNSCNSCNKPACTCPPPIIIERPVVRNGLCVKPLHGVIAMPEQGHVAMPVEGAEVPNNAYYRKLIRCGQLLQVDCDTGCASTEKEWTGRKCGSYHHDFCGPGTINIWTLLTQSQGGAASVYSVDIDLQRNDSGGGVLLVMGSTNTTIQMTETRSWTGADDGLGNLTPATDFVLSLVAGDCVKLSWTEIS